jgi:hypothetical protein
MKLWQRLLLAAIAALTLTAAALPVPDGDPWPCPLKICKVAPTQAVR